MRYLLISCIIHICVLMLFLVGVDKQVNYAVGGGGSQGGDSQPLQVELEQAAQPLKQVDTTSDESAIKDAVTLEDPNKKAEKKPELKKPEKKLEKKPEKTDFKKEKEENLKQKKERLKAGAKLKSKVDSASNTGNNGRNNAKSSGSSLGSINSNSNSNGNSSTGGSGDGMGGNDAAVGFGEGKAAEDAKIASAICEIQTKIMQYWFPPEEFAARKDIIIEVEIHVDCAGNISSYQLLNPKNTDEYRAVAASVLRVLNDPRLLPLPTSKHKRLNNIILRFCPRDLI